MSGIGRGSQCLDGFTADERSRLVGDPVDVVTGAETHFETDFRLPDAPLPLSWVRHYDSRRCADDHGVGPGFRLLFDLELRFDVDGITYVDGCGHETSFPFLASDGDEAQVDAYVLERLQLGSYRVHRPDGDPSVAFSFARELRDPARPTALIADRGRGRDIRLTYDKRGLAALEMGTAGRLLVERDGPHIVEVVLLGADGQKKRLARYAYDPLGRLAQAENGYGHSIGYGYEPGGRMARKVDRRGYSFFFSYDSDGRCVHTRGEDGVAEFRFDYRPYERLTVVTRGDGAVTRYFYDEQGSIIQIIDACGGLTAFLKDEDGRTVKEIDPAGNESLILYDALGLPVAKRDPLGHLRELPTDPTPHPLAHFLPARPGEWEHGRLYPDAGIEAGTSERSPTTSVAGATASIDRPLPAWAIAAIGPTPEAAVQPIAVAHDVQGLALREQRTDGKTRRWGLDPNGHLRWWTDFDGHTAHYEYGSWNLLRRQEEPLGRAVHFDYTVGERRSAVVDAGGTRTDFAYDAKDRLIEVRRNGRVRDRYVYDAADNLLEKRDEDGALILKLTVGPGNLVKRRELGSGDAWDLEHDEHGYLLGAKNATASCRFEYDRLGFQVADQRDGAGVRHTVVGGHVARTVVLDRFVTDYILASDGGTLVRDPADQVQRLRRLGPGVLERARSNGVRELAQYDLQGRCLSKIAEGASFDGDGWARRFSYSGEGDLLSRDDSARGRTTYHHDEARRLAWVEVPGGEDQRYGYDRADNLLHAPGLTAGFQLGNKLLVANGDRFEYDKRDHVASRTGSAGVTTYRYDSRGHLVAVDGPGLTYRARHDVLGRRTEKTVNGRTWRFTWDDDRLAAEISAAGALRIYVYPAPGALVPLSFIDYDSVDAHPASGRRHHLLTDHLGCPELVLDDEGRAVWRARILPYGRAVVEVGADFHQPLRWPGHYHDAETGLHENRFRSYSPELGRYLQSDPAGIEGGLNLYAYTDNPLRGVDLDGLGVSCPDDVPDCPFRKKDGPDQEGTGPKLPGVSESELALAASDKKTRAAARARAKVVKAFLAEHGQEWDPSTKSFKPPTSKQIRDQLKGHDLNEPVRVGPPPALPPQQTQFQRKNGNQGSYYTDEGTAPTEVGISPYARGKDGRYESKEAKPYDMNPKAPYLESTAAPVNDNWSVKGQDVPAKGGGVQRVVPDRSMATAGDN